MGEFKRLTPEEALEKAKDSNRGWHKIFLGYAPGVGKTYAMLNEANRRLSRGDSISIGYVETHGRRETVEQIKNLPVIPRKIMKYGNKFIEEMDVDGVIASKPDIVIIDELAHTNVPGSRNEKRYQDVEEILKAGINVISTLNIQHLESLNNVVEKITGVNVRETIPDKIVENADEVVVVDITPDALRNRLRRGIIYKPEVADRALKNFFRKGNLSALREIALRQVAEEVDEELAEYMEDHDIRETWYTCERVMVCISTNPHSKKLIRRGVRIARRYKCELLVVEVECTHFMAPKLSEVDKIMLEKHKKLAKDLGADIITLKGKSVSHELVKFATDRHVTQIIIGHSNRTKWQTMLRGSTVYKLLKQAKEAEIHIIPE